MSVETQSYLGVLANVDHTIRHVDFGLGLSIQRKAVDDVVRLVAQLEFLPEHEVHFTFEEQYHCLSSDRRYVWVLEGQVEVPTLPRRPSRHELHSVWHTEHAVHDHVARKFQLLRLFKEAAPDVVGSYLYDGASDNPVVNSASSRVHDVEVNRLSLTRAEAHAAREFLARSVLPFKKSYLNLAYNNFEQAYTVSDSKLKYLLLMIAAEVLFNDGAQELRYRIARGVAVLLGATLEESRMLFKTMRDLYDKRSTLVHTGSDAGLEWTDIQNIRNIVRRSLVRLAAINLPKDRLSAQLTSAGFGGFVQDVAT